MLSTRWRGTDGVEAGLHDHRRHIQHRRTHGPTVRFAVNVCGWYLGLVLLCFRAAKDISVLKR